jgi:hypothetical protein
LVQDPPAGFSPGAEEGEETQQPAEPGPAGETRAAPSPEAGQSIMASDTAPQEALQDRQDYQP